MGKSTKIKITNFTKKSTFFFHIENFLSFIYKEKNKNYIKPNQEELDSIKNLIEESALKNAENNINSKKRIYVIPKFLNALNNFEKSENKKTQFKIQVGEIIKILKNNGIKINLKKLQYKYKEICNHTYSLMTFSRIL